MYPHYWLSVILSHIRYNVTNNETTHGIGSRLLDLDRSGMWKHQELFKKGVIHEYIPETDGFLLTIDGWERLGGMCGPFRTHLEAVFQPERPVTVPWEPAWQLYNALMVYMGELASGCLLEITCGWMIKGRVQFCGGKSPILRVQNST